MLTGCPKLTDGSPTLESISASSSKTVYKIGDSLDKTAVTVTAKYSDNTTQTVPDTDWSTDFDSATAGAKTVTVTYQTKTATFDVIVAAAETTDADIEAANGLIENEAVQAGLATTVNATTEQAAALASDNGAQVELDAGDWTATIQGYRSFTIGIAKEYLAATGSETFTVTAGEINQVTVDISPLAIDAVDAPKGIFTYNITLPAGVSEAQLKLGDGAAISLLPAVSASAGSVERDAGVYGLVITLKKGDLSAAMSEVVYIYPGLESKAELDLSGIEFASLVFLMGTANAEIPAGATGLTVTAYSDAEHTDAIDDATAEVATDGTWFIKVPATFVGQNVYLKASATSTNAARYEVSDGTETVTSLETKGKASIAITVLVVDNVAVFKTTHAEALAKTTANVAISDKTVVNTALTAYDSLTDAMKTLLATEKTLLDDLLAKITQLEAAAAFTSTHETALALTVANVAISNKNAVNAALTAYSGLTGAVKALLPADTGTKLQALLDKIDALEADGMANAFRTTYTEILAKTTANVAISDKTAVNEALAAYDELSAPAKALLTEVEKAKLDALESAIGTLETAVSGFKTTNSAILAKTTANVLIADKATVTGALSAYDGLDSRTHGQLTTQKSLLDDLKSAIETLETAVSGFKSTYSTILAKTTGNVAIGDKSAVETALSAYDGLDNRTYIQLTSQKTLLDDLSTKIGQLETAAANQAAATGFTTTHAAALALSVSTATIANKGIVDAAVTAYNGLDAAVKALLSAENTLLTNLKTKIDQLGGITVSFSGADSGSLAFSEDTFTITKSGSESKTITLSGSWTSQTWYVDGASVGTGTSVTLYAVDLAGGRHNLSLTVIKDGVPWSKSVSFTVN